MKPNLFPQKDSASGGGALAAPTHTTAVNPPSKQGTMSRLDFFLIGILAIIAVCLTAILCTAFQYQTAEKQIALELKKLETAKRILGYE